MVKCSFEVVTDEIFKINFCTSKFGLTQSGECTLIKFGNMYDEGECIIFPSKEMRDWKKFSWKKGDVLISNNGSIEVIFDKWYDDTYTSFYCKHYLDSEDKNKIIYYKEFLCTTAKYSLENKDTIQTYINAIEEKLGGKLNRETLEVKKQTEFKDGDIVTLVVRKCTHIAIFQSRQEAYIGFHAVLCQNDEYFARLYGEERNVFSCKVYTTLEDLDFEVDSIFMHEEVRGTVYCRDKDTKEPVWIVSRGDEGGSWWEVNRVPDFYKVKKDKQ